MKTETLTTEKKREIISGRLSKLLEDKHYSQAYLLHLARTQYDREMTAPQLNMILKKKRSLPESFAHIFAKILEVDPGYLCGLDEYKANNYEEYQSIIKHNNEVSADFTAFKKYDHLLNPLGYYVMGMSKVGDNIIDYDIKHNGKGATIPAKEMDSFVKDVNEYINLRLMPLMKKYNDSDLVKTWNNKNKKSNK